MPLSDRTFSFEEVQRESRAGRLKVGIRRSDALAFFTQQSLQLIEERSAHRPWGAWLTVRGAVLAGPLALLGAFLFAILVLPWWTQMFMPAAIAGFIVDRQRSMEPDASSGGITLLLGLALLAPVIAPEVRLSNLHGFMLMLLFSFWSERFAPIFATWRLRSLVLQSPRAYRSLERAILLAPVSSVSD